MKQIMLLCALVVSPMLGAQSFDEYFNDQTLRIDYQFAGYRPENTLQGEQFIYLQQLYKFDGWAGRRKHLSELPLDGNYQLTVKDLASGRVIYRYSFSSLFIEWLDTEEAQQVHRAFSNTFLIPYPKKKVSVTIACRNRQGKYDEKITHIVDPTDVLIRPIGNKDTTPYEVIYNSNTMDKAVDLAFVAEGYTESEMDVFIDDVKKCCEAIFSHAPFTQLRDRFNVIAVKSASKESGVSIPRNNEWKQSIFKSHFDTFYVPRYITSSDIHGINDVLAGLPYEQIIVLGNSNAYGGGGVYNSFTLADAHNEKTLPVVVHEFGHTFGGLGDEYFYDDDMSNTYPLDVEPWEPNITTKVNFKAKWEDMYNAGTAGLYEGGGYVSKGIWRPVDNCRMRTNESKEFCPVCQRALTKIIEFYTR